MEPGTGSPGISDGAPGTGERPKREGDSERRRSQLRRSPSFLPACVRVGMSCCRCGYYTHGCTGTAGKIGTESGDRLGETRLRI